MMDLVARIVLYCTVLYMDGLDGSLATLVARVS